VYHHILVVVRDEVSLTFLPRQPTNSNPPISQVAVIIGVCHHVWLEKVSIKRFFGREFVLDVKIRKGMEMRAATYFSAHLEVAILLPF
jgi:hypothetical protein